MVNNGSPLAMLDVINSVENILTIREGQIQCYVKDAATGEWIPQPVVPQMPAPAAALATFAVPVASAASAALAAHGCKRVILLNHPDNTGRIWVGGAGVTAASGIPLEPGQSQELSIGDTSAICAIAEVDTEPLIVAYLV